MLKICTILTCLLSVLSCSVDNVLKQRQSLLSELYEIKNLDKGYHLSTLEQIFTIDLETNNLFEFIKDANSFYEKHQKDSFQGGIFTLIARAYQKMGKTDLAQYYYEKTLNAPTDVLMSGNSIKKEAIQYLETRIKDNNLSIVLRESLLKYMKPKEKIDQIHLELGYLYERIGDFSKSKDYFQSFLSLQAPNSSSNDITDVRDRLSLYDLSRDWSRRDLKQLINEIKYAINEKDIGLLFNLRTQSGFFSMSWLQERDDFNSIINFDLDRFVLSSPLIHFSEQVEEYSNSQEAYLKSWGWGGHIPVWYLYFRKAKFPADPDYNGSWEWIGIYFGDALQDNSQAL